MTEETKEISEEQNFTYSYRKCDRLTQDIEPSNTRLFQIEV